MFKVLAGGAGRRGVRRVTVVAVSLVAVLAVPPAAQAARPPAPAAPPATVSPQTAADCENGANGFVDISDSLRGTHALPALPIGFGVTVHLYFGTVAGAQRGWAMIDGSTIVGDLVWMDWSTNGGASWLQCGPFSVSSIGMTKTSAAKNTSADPNWVFRACGRAVGGFSQCTGWW